MSNFLSALTNTLGGRSVQSATNLAQAQASSDTITAATNRNNGLGIQSATQIVSGTLDQKRARLSATANALTGKSFQDASASDRTSKAKFDQ